MQVIKRETTKFAMHDWLVLDMKIYVKIKYNKKKNNEEI